MKNKFILAAIGAMMLFAGQANAGVATGSIVVSLTNVGTASVNTTPIAFGNVSSTVGSPTATGTITVNATNTMPYTVSIDGGLHANASGTCRAMQGTGTPVQSRRYQTFTNIAHTIAWGDSDTANSCSGTLDTNGGASVSGTGSGTAQALTVYAKAYAGNKLGVMNDTLTVTVAY